MGCEGHVSSERIGLNHVTLYQVMGVIEVMEEMEENHPCLPHTGLRSLPLPGAERVVLNGMVSSQQVWQDVMEPESQGTSLSLGQSRRNKPTSR